MCRHTFESAASSDVALNNLIALQLMDFSAATGGVEKQTPAVCSSAGGSGTNNGARHSHEGEMITDESNSECSRSLSNYVSSQLRSDSKLHYLGANYEVNGNDAMCGRGRATLRHDGNKAFRKTVSLFLNQFLACSKREQKQKCIADIIEVIRSSGGHFLKFDDTVQQWYDIGDKDAAAKIGHCLRDGKPSSRGVANIPSKEKKLAAKKKKNTTTKNDNSEEKQAKPLLGGDVFNGMFHPIF